MAMNKDSRIYVAGHNGLVGSAIVRQLKNQGYTNLILKTREELNLLEQAKVKAFFEKEKPGYVFLAAAKVGGIMANKKEKGDFIYQNLEIQNNVIYNSWKMGVEKLLFLGSSCIYPKLCPQPMKEEYLLSGYLEETNDAYAISKIAGIKMCQSFNSQYGVNFISLMPTNLYGINDNFDLNSSHVLPAMIRKFHEAKINNAASVELWGTGKVRREFLFVDDLADACVYLMNNYNSPGIINVGTGIDLSIEQLAIKIKELVGFSGDIKWNTEKPDGTPQKLLDVSRLNSLGWKYKIDLDKGLSLVYDWFKINYGNIERD